MVVHLLEQGGGRRGQRRAALDAEIRGLRGNDDEEEDDDGREADEDFLNHKFVG